MERIELIEKTDRRPELDASKAEYYIQQLNVNNAKKVALCLVLGFICYHGLIHLRYGKFLGTLIIENLSFLKLTLINGEIFAYFSFNLKDWL